MRYSRQRELILQTVKDHPIHPTADEIYSLVRQKDSHISLGTVYRNLNLLVDEGMLLKIRAATGPDHFDGQTHDHHHLSCERCGRVWDIEEEAVPDFNGVVSQKTGHKILSHEIIFRGYCVQCLGQGTLHA